MPCTPCAQHAGQRTRASLHESCARHSQAPWRAPTRPRACSGNRLPPNAENSTAARLVFRAVLAALACPALASAQRHAGSLQQQATSAAKSPQKCGGRAALLYWRTTSYQGDIVGQQQQPPQPCSPAAHGAAVVAPGGSRGTPCAQRQQHTQQPQQRLSPRGLVDCTASSSREQRSQGVRPARGGGVKGGQGGPRGGGQVQSLEPPSAGADAASRARCACLARPVSWPRGPVGRGGRVLPLADLRVDRAEHRVPGLAVDYLHARAAAAWRRQVRA